MIGYMVVFLFVSIGIFNLIMAVFIDNVMSQSVQRKQKERSLVSEQMEVKLKELILKLLRHETVKRTNVTGYFMSLFNRKVETTFNTKSMEAVHIATRRTQVDHAIANMEQEEDPRITRTIFDLWMKDPEMIDMLDELDIGTGDKAQIFDVLDCDRSRELEVEQVVSGLMALRGQTEKCDVVAVLLCLRWMTPLIQDMVCQVDALAAKISSGQSLQPEDASSWEGRSSALSSMANMHLPERRSYQSRLLSYARPSTGFSPAFDKHEKDAEVKMEVPSQEKVFNI